MRKILILLLLALVLLPTPAYASETVTRTVTVTAPNTTVGRDILRQHYVEIYLFEGESPPGREISRVAYSAAYLIPASETRVEGSFRGEIQIPVPPQPGENKFYHIRVGYRGGKLYPHYSSIIVSRTPGGTLTARIKNPGSFTHLNVAIALNIPLPEPQDFTGETRDMLDTEYRAGLGYWGDPRPDDSMIAKLFSRLVNNFMTSLWAIFSLQDPVTLFFGVNPAEIYERYATGDIEIESDIFALAKNATYVDPSAEDTFLYMFNPKEHQLVETIYNAFSRYLQIPYVMGVALIGALLFIKGFGGKDRSGLKVYLGGALFFPFLIRIAPYVLEPLFWMNYTVVRTIGSIAQTLTDPYGNPVHAMTRPFVTILIGEGSGLGSIGVVVATFFLVASVGILNFQYTVRRILIIVLLAMFPIVAFLQIFPTNREVLRMWFSELMSNIFLQSTHAITYLVFIFLVYQTQAPIITVIAMLISLATVSTLVRNLMGCKSNMGIAGDMIGIAGLASAGRIAGRMFGSSGSDRQSQTSSANNLQGTTTQTSQLAQAVQQAQTAQSAAQPASQATGSASEASAAQTPAPQTGTAWGISPRFTVNPGNAARNLGKAALFGGAALAGGIVGSAAMGTAGYGVGASAGGAMLGYGASAAGYGLAVGKGIADRETKIHGIQDDTYMDRDHATVFAATGVNASPEEAMLDETLSEQVTNFTDVTGTADVRNKWNAFRSEFASNSSQYLKDGHTHGSVRRSAADYRKANGDIPMVELNQRVLDDVIRPAMKPTVVPAALQPRNVPLQDTWEEMGVIPGPEPAFFASQPVPYSAQATPSGAHPWHTWEEMGVVAGDIIANMTATPPEPSTWEDFGVLPDNRS